MNAGVMWRPEEVLRTAQPVDDVAVDQTDRRLRAQIWAGILAMDVLAWAGGLSLIASAPF